jgi:hypothetical protein
MPLLDTTRSWQQSLANYCRSGEYKPIAGVREQHVQHYRRLVYNVVDDTLRAAYPLTYNLLNAVEWNGMVQEFFQEHACSSPQVWYMPKEFYEYFVQHQPAVQEKYPFLAELLLFEWLEVEIYMMEDCPADLSATGDLFTQPLKINPEHHLQYFNWPVHLKNAAQIGAADKGHYFLALHRRPDSGEVLFTSLSPALVCMLENLATAPATLETLINQACSALQLSPTPEIRSASAQFFHQALESRLTGF